jgi:hypothetical protein
MSAYVQRIVERLQGVEPDLKREVNEEQWQERYKVHRGRACRWHRTAICPTVLPRPKQLFKGHIGGTAQDSWLRRARRTSCSS